MKGRAPRDVVGRRIRWTITALSTGIAVAPIGTVVATSEGWSELAPFAAALAAVSVGPFLLYLAYVRGFHVTWVAGAVLLSWSVYSYASIVKDDSSTAGIRFFEPPLVNYLIAGTAIGIDNIRRIWTDFVRSPDERHDRGV